MKTKKIYLSDLNIIAKTITELAYRIIIYNPNNLLKEDETATNVEIITDNPRHFFYRSEELPFLLFVNLSSEKVEDFGYDAIINFFTSVEYGNLKPVSFYYVTNTNGSIRWVYPQGITKPWFLNFYYTGSKKSLAYKAVVSCLFSFRLGNLVSNGSFIAHTRQQIFVEQLLKTSTRKNYSIFTGTVGPNRKLVIAGTDGVEVNRYIKIPLTENAQKNVLNEFISINSIQTSIPDNIIIPKAALLNKQKTIIELENIKPIDITNQKLDSSHIQTLLDMYTHKSFLKTKSLNEMPFLSVIKKRLERIEKNSTSKKLLGNASLLNKLYLLHNDISVLESNVLVSTMHGDFTPWNMYLSKDEVCLYDWEFAEKSVPIFYDFFHYIMQSEILIKHSAYGRIKNKIDTFFAQPVLANFIEKHALSVKLYYKLYLLQVVSYYLELYQNQVNQHQQVYWLLKVWNLALEDMVQIDEKGQYRQVFTTDFFKHIGNTQYAVLKHANKSFFNVDSTTDIDLLMGIADSEKIIDWIGKHPLVKAIKINKKHFMYFVEISFTNGDFLSIDFISSFSRKYLEYMPSNDLLKDVMVGSEFKVLPPKFDFEYIFLFYCLNKSCIPSSYIQYFNGLNATVQTTVLDYINNRYHLSITSFNQLEVFNPSTYKLVKNVLLNSTVNNLQNRLIRSVKYGYDTFKNIIKSKGLIITFSGVDGAGKTTILQETEQTLKNFYRRNVVVLRHRPSILPILSAFKHGKAKAENLTTQRAPRTGTNNSTLSSLCRFSYYYIDYVFGQIWIHLKYISRGYVVIYDRYYFDFIVDGKRSNVVLPTWLTKFLYFFIQKPDVSVFLYADAETILKRKQELPAADIAMLTQNYMAFFNAQHNSAKYLCIENIEKKRTLQHVISAYNQA